jgi:hypothetical protein
MSQEKLQVIKGRVDQLKAQKIIKEEKLKELLLELKKQYNIKDLDAAYERIDQVVETIDELTIKKEKMIKKAEKKLEDYE